MVVYFVTVVRDLDTIFFFGRIKKTPRRCTNVFTSQHLFLLRYLPWLNPPDLSHDPRTGSISRHIIRETTQAENT